VYYSSRNRKNRGAIMSHLLRSVLVPLDGSAFAEHAVPLAGSIARRAGAALHLVRVVPDLADEHFWVPLPNSQLESELRARARREAEVYLKEVHRRLNLAGDVLVVADVVFEKEGITESIRDDALAIRADLVVMSYRGRGSLARFWFGSVADSLVDTLSVPVLLVRPTAAVADLEHDVPLRHILVPLDGSAEAEVMLEPVLAIGKAVGADFTLVQVVAPGQVAAHPTHGGAKTNGVRPAALDYLQTVAERLRADGARVETQVVVARQPANAILKESAGADLIAVETHGRSAASRFLWPSVAHEVVHGGNQSVLVYRLPR
jgi:nucleotide-binding universal stress UspA family protein